MAMADQALFGYDTFAGLQEQEIPAGQDELVLRFRDSVLDRIDVLPADEDPPLAEFMGT